MVFFVAYLIAAINLGDFFTFSGASAVYLSFTFLMIGKIVHEIDMIRNRVYFTNYLKAMDRSEPQETPKNVLDRVAESSK